MGVLWMLMTLILTIAAVQPDFGKSTKPHDRSSLLLTDRIDRLERDLLNLSDQVSMNEIENLRIGLSYYYYFLLLFMVICFFLLF